MLNPITFSTPNEKIINYIPIKTKILSSLIPGKLRTYIYNNEEDDCGNNSSSSSEKNVIESPKAIVIAKAITMIMWIVIRRRGQ
jgi:hypothetical protein